MQRFTHSAVILAPAGIQCVNPREAQNAVRPEPAEGAGGMSWFVCHDVFSPFGELLLALPKSNQKASPGPRLFPAVLATGGTKTNRPMARCRARWAHGFWSWTARCSAPRRGLTGRLVTPQLLASNDWTAVVAACFSRLSTLSFLSWQAPLDGRRSEKVMCRVAAAKVTH
jgi:hypothetical protein